MLLECAIIDLYLCQYTLLGSDTPTAFDIKEESE